MITTINEFRKINEYYVNNEVEDTLRMFMDAFYKYCKSKNHGQDIVDRMLELIEELKDADLREFLTWVHNGSTLKLQELLRNTTYKGNGNTPEQLLDFNSFATLDTIGMYYRDGYINEL